MIQNYIKIIFRHLWKDKLYSIINVAGLATAITCILLAVMYWNNEHNFDNFHTNNPNLYRITTTLIEQKGAKAVTYGTTGQVQGLAFKEAVPEIKNYTRIMGGEIYNDVSTEDKTLHLNSLFVDDSFFQVFTFQLLKGNIHTALRDINSVVITKSTALRFFNRVDVVGEVLQMNADPSFQKLGKPLVISAVVDDPPRNSSIQFDALFPFDFMGLSFKDTNWLNAYLGTFVVLESNANIDLVKQKFNLVFESLAKDQVAANFKSYGYNAEISYGLQPLTDVHLNAFHQTSSNTESGIVNVSKPVYSYIFIGVALFILLMATINFINLSIANSLKRAKEVGVRKITGGNRWHILMEFLGESAIVCTISFIVALFILNSLLPLFNNLTDKLFLFTEILEIGLILLLLCVFLFIIILTGLYPALVLSNFKATEVLYNKQSLKGSNLFGRSLVVFQFSLGVFFLISALAYRNQMEYISTKDLGYNPNQIISTSITGNRDYEAIGRLLKIQLSSESSVKSVAHFRKGFSGKVDANNIRFDALHQQADEAYYPLLEIPILAGRNFSTDSPAESKNAVIVNQAFIKQSGLTDPIGQSIKIFANEEYSERKTIIGIVKDYHLGSLREPIKPIVVSMNRIPYGSILVKFNKSKQKEALTVLENVYKKAMPDAVFKYDFLNELNARQYEQDIRWQKVVNMATIISFIICSLGLFGLAHLSTNQRIKEIGIRKVLGATVTDITIRLSADFLKLVLISLLIAIPIAWWVISLWLQEFAYRMEMGSTIFIIACLSTFKIALFTVSFQAIKAALMNPVKSLRSE